MRLLKATAFGLGLLALSGCVVYDPYPISPLYPAYPAYPPAVVVPPPVYGYWGGSRWDGPRYGHHRRGHHRGHRHWR